MRQNRNSNKKSLSKNLKYMKTFESFEGDYQLMLEEENLAKGIGMGLLALSTLGAPQLQAMNPGDVIDAKEITIPQKTEVSDQDTTFRPFGSLKVEKSFARAASPGKKFDLQITGFKPENVTVRERQLDIEQFSQEVIEIVYTTSKKGLDGKYVSPSIGYEEGLVKVFNSKTFKVGEERFMESDSIDPDMKLIITVCVLKSDVIDPTAETPGTLKTNTKGEAMSKTEWTLNGKSFSEYTVSPGNDKNTVTLEE